MVPVGSLVPVGPECHPAGGVGQAAGTPRAAPTPAPATRSRRVRPARPLAGDPLDLVDRTRVDTQPARSRTTA
jgi:hypothetical protein